MLIQKNLFFSLLNYILTTFLKFGVRFAFVRTLSLDYLGINGLFTELLAMLSLAELGLGTSIVYSLYKPLAAKDERQTAALMQLFRRLYLVIGAVIFGLGLLLYPWLEVFVKAVPAIPEWKLFYLAFLFNTAVSYLWSYQRNLLIADQKQYLVQAYDCCVQLGVALAQLVALLCFHSYWLYLFTLVAGTILENILLDRRAKQQYVLTQARLELECQVKAEITKNVKALLVHRLAGAMVLSSTNLILAKLLGLAAVGLCSNYLLITGTLNALGGRLMGSLTATVGHQLILADRAANQVLFQKMQLATYAVASVCSVGLYTLLNPFVDLWLGKQYLLPEATVAFFVVYFYLHFIRGVSLLFRDAAGLFYQDRVKAVVELLLNVCLNWYLVQRNGIEGIFIAGIISTLVTCTWAEPYIVFKYALGLSLKTHLLKLAGYSMVTVLGAMLWKYLFAIIGGGPLTVPLFIVLVAGIIITMGAVWAGLWLLVKE